jgi:hypothetical protein
MKYHFHFSVECSNDTDEYVSSFNSNFRINDPTKQELINQFENFIGAFLTTHTSPPVKITAPSVNFYSDMNNFNAKTLYSPDENFKQSSAILGKQIANDYKSSIDENNWENEMSKLKQAMDKLNSIK